MSSTTAATHAKTPPRPKRPWMIPPSPLALPAAVSATTKCTEKCTCAPVVVSAAAAAASPTPNSVQPVRRIRVVTPSVLLAVSK